MGMITKCGLGQGGGRELSHLSTVISEGSSNSHLPTTGPWEILSKRGIWITLS